MKVLGVLALCVAAVAAKEIGRSLDRFEVLSVTAVTPTQFSLLKKLVQDDELDFWTSPKYQGVTDIMVSPEQKGILTTLFAAEGMKWSVKISNVGKIVNEQRAENNKRLKTTAGMSWTAYHSYNEIVTWLQSIASNNLVTLSVIGQSSEGRDIHQVKISTGPTANGELKPAIFIDALFHAREWVTGAAVTYIINEIINNPSANSEILSKFDLFVVPIANPDGYEYSRQGNNRMWRKTRSTNQYSTCLGCDPNRNFAFQFGGEGTSSNPCSDIYKGENAFSEPETAAISKAINSLQSERRVHAYYTVHSYSQLWLLSWGYTQGAYPDDYPELLAWGKKSVNAIRNVHGKSYQAGQGADILYGVGGAADDWAKSEGVKYVTTLEVRDTGYYGFLLPAEQIIPTAEEIWEGIKVITTTV